MTSTQLPFSYQPVPGISHTGRIARTLGGHRDRGDLLRRVASGKEDERLEVLFSIANRIVNREPLSKEDVRREDRESIVVRNNGTAANHSRVFAGSSSSGSSLANMFKSTLTSAAKTSLSLAKSLGKTGVAAARGLGDAIDRDPTILTDAIDATTKIVRAASKKPPVTPPRVAGRRKSYVTSPTTTRRRTAPLSPSRRRLSFAKDELISTSIRELDDDDDDIEMVDSDTDSVDVIAEHDSDIVKTTKRKYSTEMTLVRQLDRLGKSIQYVSRSVSNGIDGHGDLMMDGPMVDVVVRKLRDLHDHYSDMISTVSDQVMRPNFGWDEDATELSGLQPAAEYTMSVVRGDDKSSVTGDRSYVQNPAVSDEPDEVDQRMAEIMSVARTDDWSQDDSILTEEEVQRMKSIDSQARQTHAIPVA